MYSLIYPACNAHVPNCNLWPPQLYIIFPLSHKRLDLLKRTLLNTKCLFWFPLKILSEKCLILRRNERDMIKTFYSLHVKYTWFLSDFNETWIFSTVFLNIHVCRISCGQTEGQTWQMWLSVFAILRTHLKSMSGTDKNKVEYNCVKMRQKISQNIRNMINGIELRVNEDKLQDKDEKIRKPFSANVCHCPPQRYTPRIVRVKHLCRNDILVGNSSIQKRHIRGFTINLTPLTFSRIWGWRRIGNKRG